MKQHTTELRISTREPMEFIDITDEVKRAFSASGVTDGALTVFTRHTTTAVKVNERCDRLQQDMLDVLKGAVPARGWRHDEGTVDGRPNARGHLMSMFLNSSETIPVSGGSLALGGWQSVFLVELDGPRTERRVIVKVMGE
ncbi:MAG: YjbQ family protein [Proteobacteria bacterium]|nr:YjbQ family protein [Pseudomonadota bacterium]